MWLRDRCGLGCLGSRRTDAGGCWRSPRLLFAFLVLGGQLGCEGGRTQPISLPFELILRDSGSARAGDADRSAPSYRLFFDGASLEDHWRDISTVPAPPVRFGHELVLWISMGTQRTGGYAVELEEVRFEPRKRRLHCTLHWSEPQEGSLLLQALTAPRAIYRVAFPVETRIQDLEALQVRFVRAGQGKESPVDLMRLP